MMCSRRASSISHLYPYAGAPSQLVASSRNKPIYFKSEVGLHLPRGLPGNKAGERGQIFGASALARASKS